MTAGATISLWDCDAAQLRLCARQNDSANQVRRLSALAAIYDGALREVARINGITRQIVQDRIERLNTGSPDVLITCKAPGNSSLLIDDQRAALAQAVENGPTPAIHYVVLGALSIGAVGMGPVLSQYFAPAARPRAAHHAVIASCRSPTPSRASAGRGGSFLKKLRRPCSVHRS